MKMFRQGDVLLVQVQKIPADATACKVDGDIILAYGEVTGHAHRLDARTVKPLAKGGVWEPSAERFIPALEGAVVRQEEHGDIAIPKGNYRVVQQVEYTPGQIRNVAD